jgi:hypothetical protein
MKKNKAYKKMVKLKTKKKKSKKGFTAPTKGYTSGSY